MFTFNGIKDKVVFCGLVVGSIGMVIIPIVCSIFRSPVHCDSAYYVLIGENICNGLLPYKELSIGYPPVFFYLESIYKIIFQIPNGCYWPYLLLYYILQLCSAYFIYNINVGFGINKKISCFSSLLYVLVLHWNECNNLLLEVPSMFFGFLSCWLLIKNKGKSIINYAYIGCIASFAFLTKQYGLVFLVLGIYTMLFVNSCSYREVIVYLSGYLIPIVICLLIWDDYFIQLFVSSYGSVNDSGEQIGVVSSDRIIGIFKCLYNFCVNVFPVLFMLLLCLGKIVRQKRLKYILFPFIGLLGFSLQFYFAQYTHYNGFLIPFACMIVAELISLKKNIWMQVLTYSVLSVTIIISVFQVYRKTIWNQYLKHNQREMQIEVAKNIQNYVNKDETIWIPDCDVFCLYLLSNRYPPNLSSIGYSFGSKGLDAQRATKQALDADYIISIYGEYGHSWWFEYGIKDLISSKNSIPMDSDNTIMLYKMK